MILLKLDRNHAEQIRPLKFVMILHVKDRIYLLQCQIYFNAKFNTLENVGALLISA